MTDYTKTGVTVSNIKAMRAGDAATQIASVEFSGTSVFFKNAAGAVIMSGTTQDTTYTPATAAKDGLLSSADKSKLDGLGNYVLPQATDSVLGGVKITTATDSDSTTVVLAASAGKAIMDFAKASGRSLELSGTTLKLKDSKGTDLASVEIPPNYVLPTASPTEKGGIKIGQGLAVAADGTVSVAVSGGMRFVGTVPSVKDLPSEGNQNGDLYLVGTASPYAEFMYGNSAWEQLGIFDTGYDTSKLVTTDDYLTDDEFLAALGE